MQADTINRTQALARLRNRSLAVGSGKGGVGKSTTAVNLAVYYARHFRVGLIDLDPLANVATILDVPEADLSHIASAVNRNARRIEDYRYEISSRLHVLFPRPKLERGESTRILSLLYNAFSPVIAETYDLLVFDMPAGISKEENLAFLPHIGTLLIVTNPEPTSHVSAGGYVKAALEIAPEIRILMWHNRYSPISESDFNPRAVLHNYNSYVPEELKLPRKVVLGQRDVAFIPDDPSLDLLQNEVGIETGVLIKLLEVTGLLFDRLLLEHDAPQVDGLDSDHVRFYLQQHRELVADAAGTDVAEVMRDMGGHVDAPQSASAVQFGAYLESLAGDRTMHLAADAARAVYARLEDVRESSRLFTLPRRTGSASAVERRLVALMQHLQKHRAEISPFVRNTGGLILFYYCVYRLVRVETVGKLLTGFIPTRSANGRGPVRDKRRQIEYLLQRDDEYHSRYFSLIKRLFPLMNHQIARITNALRVSGLLFRDGSGKIKRNAYLILLTNFVHDTVHTGLGIFVGFRFNAASRAIQDGAHAVQKLTGLGAARTKRP